MTKRLTKQFYSALLVFCLAAAGLGVTAASVSGAPLPPGEGTLTIHKYSLADMDTAGDPGHGTEQSNLPEGAVLVAGITFSVWEVDTSGGVPVTPEEAKERLIPSSLQTGMTGTAGTAVFNLKRGVYYVEETNSTGRIIGSDGTEGAEQSFMGIKPFLVSVPMTNESGDGWITDVHVYPKNQALTIDSFVNEVGSDYEHKEMAKAKLRPAAIQEIYGYSIVSVIPAAFGKRGMPNTKANDSSLTAEGTGPESYVITTQLKECIDFKEGLMVYSVAAPESSYQEGSLLVEAADYIKTYQETNRTLSIKLTEAGMDKVGIRYAGSTKDRYLLIRFQAQLNNQAPQGVNISQGAAVTYTTGGSELSSKVVVEPAVHTGQIGIQKLDEKDKSKGLAGAEFALSVSEQDAKAGKYFASGVTGPEGRLNLKGIKYGEPGVDYTTVKDCQDTFWLTEIKAPNGYAKVDQPFEIKYNRQKDEKTGEYYFARVAVYNKKLTQKTVTPTPKPGITQTSTARPKTGDYTKIAVWAVALIGSAAVILIIFLAVRKRKRANS